MCSLSPSPVLASGTDMYMKEDRTDGGETFLGLIYIRRMIFKFPDPFFFSFALWEHKMIFYVALIISVQ